MSISIESVAEFRLPCGGWEMIYTDKNGKEESLYF
jgi:hypothetical protein